MSHASEASYLQEVKRLMCLVDFLKQGLEDVVNPVGELERELPEGCTLDGRSIVYMLDRPTTYIRIAKDTLAEYERRRQ